MTVDERIGALTMNLELAFRDIQELKAVAPVAEARQRPIEDLEEHR